MRYQLGGDSNLLSRFINSNASQFRVSTFLDGTCWRSVRSVRYSLLSSFFRRWRVQGQGDNRLMGKDVELFGRTQRPTRHVQNTNIFRIAFIYTIKSQPTLSATTAPISETGRIFAVPGACFARRDSNLSGEGLLIVPLLATAEALLVVSVLASDLTSTSTVILSASCLGG